MLERFKAEIEVVRLVWRHARGQHLKLAIAMVLELVIGVFPPVSVYIVQKWIGIHLTDLHSLLTYSNILLVLAVYFVYIVLTKISRIMTAYAVAEVEYSLRMEFTQALRRMSFISQVKKIGLQTAQGLTQEISMASSLIPMIYRSFLRATTTIVAFCVVLTVISPKYFLMTGLLLLAVVVSVVVLRRRIKRTHAGLYNRISSLYVMFAEWINGFRVFKVYDCVDYAERRMRDVYRSIRDISRSLTVVTNSQAIFVEMLTYSVAVLLIVMMPSVDGKIDVGVLVSFPAAMLFVRGEAIVLINGYQQLANTESSIRRFYNVVKSGEDSEEVSESRQSIVSIEMHMVSFGYDDNVILSEADLTLRCGELHVLAGRSGVGKTTTVNLLLGLLRPQAGEINYLHSDSENVGVGMALVEQEPFIFDGSIYDNIAMGRADVTIDRVMELIKALGLGNVFADRQSLTESRESSSRKLSTGEKQRIALIRALAGNPSVLVLDEVTSNVDAATSRIIMDYLREVSKTVLTVVVSHDPMVLECADRLYSLSDGKFQQHNNIQTTKS